MMASQRAGLRAQVSIALDNVDNSTTFERRSRGKASPAGFERLDQHSCPKGNNGYIRGSAQKRLTPGA